MSKRSIETTENTEAANKKMKSSQETTSVQSIPDDVWSQKIFPFLSGNDLFTNQRLVCSSWNNRVLSTRCVIDVSLNDEESVNRFIASAGLFKNIVGLSLKSKPKISDFIEKIANLDWQSLASLELRDAELVDEDVKHLANGNMKGLTSLDLSSNSIGNAGIEYLSNGNITGLTSLKVYNNDNIDEEGAKHLLSGNLKGLTTLNYQTLGKQGDNKFLAMTAHFCGDTPFTVHSFDNIDEYSEYIFKYYLNYWLHYGRESLSLEDEDEDEEDEPNEPVLRKAVFALPLGKMFDMATCEVGGMVYNECEREGIVSLVYGQELTEDLLSKADESTPFAIVEKNDGYEYKTVQVIGKSKFLEYVEKHLGEGGDDEEEDEEKEDEDDEEEEDNEKDVGDSKLSNDSKLFKTISKKIKNNVSSGEDVEEGMLACVVGENLAKQFILLK